MSVSSSSDNQKVLPKVLRIGLVHGGKIIEERELKKRETVSVGSQKGMFVVSSEALPRSFDLFDYEKDKYFLCFTEAMEGRIQISGSRVADFPTLKKEGTAEKRGEVYAVELTDESRGKVVIGDVTVLFQFKVPVADPVRPVLPADVRGSILQNIDSQFAGIFVAVAVLQISLVSYARSLPYVEPSSLEEVSEVYQRMIAPQLKPEPKKSFAEERGGEEKAKEKEKEKEKSTEEKSKVSKAPRKDTKKSESAVDAEAAARARKAAVTKAVAGKGLLKVLGSSRGGGDGAVADVFSEGGVSGELGAAFSGIQGVDIAGSGSGSATRGGGAGRGVDIGSLGTSGGGSVSSGSKTEADVRGALRAETPEVDGDLSREEIAKVMKRQLQALRDCYEHALKRNRGLTGKVIIKFEILESGRTANISFDEDSLKSGDVRECIERRAKFWRFPKPEGGSVFVAYPIVFTSGG